MHPVALTKPKNHYTAVHGDGSERVAQVKYWGLPALTYCKDAGGQSQLASHVDLHAPSVVTNLRSLIAQGLVGH